MKITESQIKEAYERPELLKELFPDVFKPELEVNRWYKCTAGTEYLVFVEKALGGIEENYSIQGYGFNSQGEYELFHPNNLAGSHDIRLATEEEITEALTKEAIRRGFKGGVEIKDATGKVSKLKNDWLGGVVWFKFDNQLETGCNYQKYNSELFKNGKWAEIIEPKEIEMTLEEVAKLANVDRVKIVDKN